MKSTHESEIVLARFEEVCPSQDITDMTAKDINESVNVAFKIIGYVPRNFQKAVDDAMDKMNGKGELFRLCYNAWRLDE